MPQVALGLAASKGLAPVAFFFQVEDHFRAGSLRLSIRNIAIAYHEGDAAYLTPAQLTATWTIGRLEEIGTLNRNVILPASARGAV